MNWRSQFAAAAFSATNFRVALIGGPPARGGGFKNGSLKSGRYDGIERDDYFSERR